MKGSSPHPTTKIDADVHQRVRLGILSVLHEVREADFSFLAKELELTDGNLSRNLRVLEDKGLVTIRKEFDNRRPRTWLSVTPEGRKAFLEEVRALSALIKKAGKLK